jgi:protein-L-isoaspartate(D-aspartate) O-methyltransferase
MKNKREWMVRTIKDKYGLDSPEVLSVMLQIPRDKFVPGRQKIIAYDDAPVPIGFGQTMSQPYTVAVMTHLLVNQKSKTKNQKVLEIGTGSGYQAAVLSKLFKKVYTIEIIPQLARKSKGTLQKLGYKDVFVKTGSGEWGWSENAPFDVIMITAGVEKVPNELFKQLKVGGVLVAPVGKGSDKVMTRYTKLKNRKTEKLKNGKTKHLSNQVTKKLINQTTKLPRHQITKKLKTEKFGTFRFVPFVEEKD